MSRATYEIRVAGAVPPEVIEDFEGVSTVSMVTDTTLRADLVDTSSLHGLLAALRRAGLVLLDVRRDLWADDDEVLDVDDPEPPS
jgi:hypothetical protein